MNPDIITKLTEIKDILDTQTSPGGPYQSYNFSIFVDDTGISYNHTVNDGMGNSITIAERQVI